MNIFTKDRKKQQYEEHRKASRSTMETVSNPYFAPSGYILRLRRTKAAQRPDGILSKVGATGGQ